MSEQRSNADDSKVVPLFGRRSPGAARDHSGADTATAEGGIVYERPQREARARRRVAPQQSQSDRAYESIRAVAEDTDLSVAERSNLFDLWKSSIRRLAEEGSSAEVQQVLGLLIVATTKKDVNHFSVERLRAFRDISYLLRAPRLIDIEVATALTILRRAGISALAPLSPESLTTERRESLERKLSQLLSE